MALYLDSAIVSEAEAASQLGWVKGVTTNPTLLAKSDLSPQATLKALKQLFRGEIYYQLTALDFDSMLEEAWAAYNILGEQTVLKVPATSLGFQVVAHISPKIACSVTGIYSASQAAVAKEAGAKYAIAYVNRATRFLGDGITLVKDMAEILAGSETKILAASIKSPEEAVATLKAGAYHLTLPWDILQSLTTHELSNQTVQEFHQNGRGLLS
ncbi:MULTISPECIES: transaldolase family protein [Arthrospira]|uniref:Transaldolase family protein n=1 Tax=Limnospira platensis NIES-46 TaxID=1236695 RepID=A0A5M3T8C8_LIMPL|nr:MULTISPECIES: transaldolase family protein [Arthrospira]AMW28177.1 transaldolase [Arthrospira platensis YZ]KDR58954.1 transaldolase [Arthrospira platensis str. Paraca]MBD2668373.1 transaldolase [Arthrospira platensis FACHB-439]MBD2710039.1 transaldolase [Arthrospira platensis FACHB-835]MDF2209312.1 transaldolase family protein [Arthrospira platensis NCB002]MDT9181977.1 transaldolase family protein [Limnospira sp. PMC 289.06]MDT9294144.1 transaldolase family protein [Arthrospira platensis 